MKLIELKESELEDVEHFLETGKRKGGVVATDEWVEQSLKKAVKEIVELKDRCGLHWETARGCISVVEAARELHRAWKKGEEMEPLFEKLGQSLKEL